MSIKDRIYQWRAKRKAKRIAKNMKSNLRHATYFMQALGKALKEQNDENGNARANNRGKY